MCFFGGGKISVGDVGDDYVIDLAEGRFIGSYCSVWFDKPNRFTKVNTEVEGAPGYYIDFSWKKFLEPRDALQVLTGWLQERGLLGYVSSWEKAFHCKYFFQGRDVNGKWVELWTEVNSEDGVAYRVAGIEPRLGLERGRYLASVGFPMYGFKNFRVVGWGAQHPLDSGVFKIKSNYKNQLLVHRRVV